MTFICDTSTRFHVSPFSLYLCVVVLVDRFNHELVFGVSVKNLSKAERLIYGDSLMTHAMILTAVTDKVATQPAHTHSPVTINCHPPPITASN